MTAVLGVLEQRLLGALAQVAGGKGGGSRKDLEPREPGNLRAAAAVFERVAELPSREVMAARLREIAETIGDKREGRDDGEKELFTQAADLVESLSEVAPGKQGLLGLKLWSEAGVPLGPVSNDLRSALPQTVAVDEALLVRAARALLRGRARAWTTEARRRERAEGEA